MCVCREELCAGTLSLPALARRPLVRLHDARVPRELRLSVRVRALPRSVLAPTALLAQRGHGASILRRIHVLARSPPPPEEHKTSLSHNIFHIHIHIRIRIRDQKQSGRGLRPTARQLLRLSLGDAEGSRCQMLSLPAQALQATSERGSITGRRELHNKNNRNN